MAKRVLAISNHATFVGGGEHSYMDLILHLPSEFTAIACLPSEDVLSEKTREKGIRTVIGSLPRISPMSVRLMAGSIGELKNICRIENINLIYANGARAAFYGGIVGRLCSIPVVWHCRVSEADPYLDFILIRLVNCVIANSRATASRFSRFFHGKVAVVYNGFDLQRLREPKWAKPALIQDHWICILVVARVSRWKKHDLLISAFERVAALESNAHLICVGAEDSTDPQWREELQRMTQRSPFSERIHWIGAVDDVRPWYHSALMLVLPSINEPFGRVVVEALACGVPVIAARSGGVPEIITDMQNGMLVPANDAEAISKAAIKLLHDQSLRKQLAEEGFKRAEHFSMASHIEGMVSVFESLTDHLKRN